MILDYYLAQAVMSIYSGRIDLTSYRDITYPTEEDIPQIMRLRNIDWQVTLLRGHGFLRDRYDTILNMVSERTWKTKRARMPPLPQESTIWRGIMVKIKSYTGQSSVANPGGCVRQLIKLQDLVVECKYPQASYLFKMAAATISPDQRIAIQVEASIDQYGKIFWDTHPQYARSYDPNIQKDRAYRREKIKIIMGAIDDFRFVLEGGDGDGRIQFDWKVGDLAWSYVYQDWILISQPDWEMVEDVRRATDVPIKLRYMRDMRQESYMLIRPYLTVEQDIW